MRRENDQLCALRARIYKHATWEPLNSTFLAVYHRVRNPPRLGRSCRQDQVAGAVAVEGFFVFAADYGEGVEDVAGVVAAQAVEVEVEGVEPGAQVAALLFVPDKGRAVMAEVAGEGRHVVGGVGQAKHVITD